MKELRVGDRVKFLNDTGSGVVTKVVDKELVMVSTDDGFEYPVLKSELLATAIAEEDINTDPERLAEDDIFSDTDDSLEEDKPEKESDDIKTPENRYEYKAKSEVDKDSKFYKKAQKIRDREKAKKQKKSTGIEEVDLHIAQIIDDFAELSSGEIVEIQLARFRTSLEGAIKAGQKKIIFIHGKGAGKLKRDINRIIDNEYPRCVHQDASFAEYGFGASLILIN